MRMILTKTYRSVREIARIEPLAETSFYAVFLQPDRGVELYGGFVEAAELAKVLWERG